MFQSQIVSFVNNPRPKVYMIYIDYINGVPMITLLHSPYVIPSSGSAQSSSFGLTISAIKLSQEGFYKNLYQLICWHQLLLAREALCNRGGNFDVSTCTSIYSERYDPIDIHYFPIGKETQSVNKGTSEYLPLLDLEM